MKFIFASFLLFISANLFGQGCDSLTKDQIQQFDSYSSRKLNTFKKKKHNRSTPFLIATYLRQKGDTSYREWYRLFIEDMKSCYDCIPKDLLRCYSLRIGIAYFYLENYHDAHTWFEKTAGLGFVSDQLKFYQAETEKKLKR